MRFADTTRPNETQIPQIPRDRIRLRWASGYWDGPMDGLAEVDGEIVWYTFAEESEDNHDWFRRYWLVRLTPEQLAQELRRHEDFQLFVGRHFDYDENWQRHGHPNPQSMWKGFYDKYSQDQRDPGLLSENQVIGWFEW